EHAERDRPGRRHPALRRRRLRARHAARTLGARRGAPLMRVAIAGAGNVGLFIANDLRAASHEVLIIEQNPAVVRRAQTESDGIEWHVADACGVSSRGGAGPAPWGGGVA